MQNKLQELTEKLYSEGLSKGRKEAEELKKKAKAEADEIIAKANEEYKEIVAKAKKEAEDLKLKMLNEVKMASKQSLQRLKTEIETLILTKSVAEPLKPAMTETEFLKKVILAAISAFKPENAENNSLELLLPENLKKELESYIDNEIKREFSGSVVVNFDNKLQNGFKIGPKEEGYFISFTDNDFSELIAEYLRPKTYEILFSAK